MPKPDTKHGPPWIRNRIYKDGSKSRPTMVPARIQPPCIPSKALWDWPIRLWRPNELPKFIASPIALTLEPSDPHLHHPPPHERNLTSKFVSHCNDFHLSSPATFTMRTWKFIIPVLLIIYGLQTEDHIVDPKCSRLPSMARKWSTEALNCCTWNASNRPLTFLFFYN